MELKNLFFVVVGMGISILFLQISIYLQNKREEQEKEIKNKDLERMGFILWTLFTSGEGCDSISRKRTLEDDAELRKICEKIYLSLPQEDIDKLLNINPDLTNQADYFMKYFQNRIEDD